MGTEAIRGYNAVKVFTATKAKERESLGETITSWLSQRPEIEVLNTVITQSSDNEFHCLTITIFYKK